MKETSRSVPDDLQDAIRSAGVATRSIPYVCGCAKGFDLLDAVEAAAAGTAALQFGCGLAER